MFSHRRASVLLRVIGCVFGFRVARVTEREDQTRATDQQGKTTTEATDQGSDQGLHVGFVDAELQQKNYKNKKIWTIGTFSKH